MAKREEFSVIYQILTDNARWLEARGVWQWPIDWIEQQKHQLQDAVFAGKFYIMQSGDEVGAVALLSQATEAIWEHETSPSMYVHKLAVNRKVQLHAAGRHTLRLIKEHAAQLGLAFLRLDCVAHNKKLREFYLSVGFDYVDVVYDGEIDVAKYQLAVR